jgi:hypothetical protein
MNGKDRGLIMIWVTQSESDSPPFQASQPSQPAKKEEYDKLSQKKVMNQVLPSFFAGLPFPSFALRSSLFLGGENEGVEEIVINNQKSDAGAEREGKGRDASRLHYSFTII